MVTTSADHDVVTCDVALSRVFGFLGKRWNGLILGVLGGGPMGFAALARAVHGISDSVLSERLASSARPAWSPAASTPARRSRSRTSSPRAGGPCCPALRELIRWAEQHPDGPC